MTSGVPRQLSALPSGDVVARTRHKRAVWGDGRAASGPAATFDRLDARGDAPGPPEAPELPQETHGGRFEAAAVAGSGVWGALPADEGLARPAPIWLRWRRK